MRHCEGAKRPKQSRSKFSLKFRHCEGAKRPKQSLRIPYKKFNGILEFPKNLEFLRINLEFLEIASAFSKPRNDGILDGILNEIASVALLPRNDAGNSQFICDVILGSSPRMTQGLGILVFS